MRHEYTDTELQAAIDEAFAKETHRFFLSPSSFYWDQEAPNRLDLIKSALAALPEPEPLVTKPISLTSPTQMNDGGPAFPITENGLQGYNGMSLRDYFAGQALIMLPNHGCGADLDSRETAEAAYQIADAMLKAR